MEEVIDSEEPLPEKLTTKDEPPPAKPAPEVKEEPEQPKEEETKPIEQLKPEGPSSEDTSDVRTGVRGGSNSGRGGYRTGTRWRGRGGY